MRTRKTGHVPSKRSASALGEKIAALETGECLEARAACGSRAKFRKALARVPDVEPEENDRLD